MSETVLQSRIEEQEFEVLKNAREQYGRISDAFKKVCWILSELAVHGGEDPEGDCPNASERLSLSATLLQSCFIVETLISSGHYVSAVAIIRQHMEVLARLIELREGVVVGKSSKIPNVSKLPFSLSQNYGPLSKLVHTSKGEYLACFTETFELEGIASCWPIFRKDWAHALLCVHIAHMLTLAIEIAYLQQSFYPLKAVVVSRMITEGRDFIGAILVDVGFWGRS